MISNKIWQRKNRDFPERKLTIDFAKTKKSPFDIKAESSYNSYLSKGALTLGLRKPNCIAWVEMPDYEYQDHVIEAKFRLDSLGGYAAAGIIYHINDDSYYLALISSKGYFRLDLIKNHAPKTLIAWTEVSDFNRIRQAQGEQSYKLNIIVNGANHIFIANGKWLCEITDDTVESGKIGFALASYETPEEVSSPDETTVLKEDVSASPADGSSTDISDDDISEPDEEIRFFNANDTTEDMNKYTSKAKLDYIIIDTHTKSVEEHYKKWTSDNYINAEERLRLAETIAVMGDYSGALEQIKRAWKRRDEAISSVTATYTEIRTKKELLFASRLAFNLDNYSEAEEYTDSLLDQWQDSAEGKLAYTEKIKILNELDRFAELKDFFINNPFKINKDIDYYTILARCQWELEEYEESAKAWEKAFELNSENAVYAANAANAYDLAGKKKQALEYFIKAGRIFLNQDNKAELEVMMPRLSALGVKNWEARSLAGKWFYSIEDYNRCEEEFEAANKIRGELKQRPQADPAVFYLWALVLHLKGKGKNAIRLLEKAVEIAPDYGLFRFKLAEVKLIYGITDFDIAQEFKTALKQIDDPDGQLAEYAASMLINIGDSKNAKYFMDKIKQKNG